MQSFIAACVVAIVLAVGGALVLQGVQQSADHAFASSTGVRI
jgi:hypothetical protein